jgi:hypothetical protein
VNDDDREALRARVARLTAQRDELTEHIRTLKALDLPDWSDNVHAYAALRRRPYGGTDPEWQAAVREVIDAANASGTPAAPAVERVFRCARPTAYKWVRELE